MPRFEFLEPDAGLAPGGEAPDVTQHAALCARRSVTLLHLRIVTRKPRQEILAPAARQFGGHEAFHAHVAQFQRQAEFTAEDDELARHVRARQVIARIGLGVAASTRIADYA